MVDPTTDTPEKNAAYWLDRACDYEAKGNEKGASLALKTALRKDDEEHAGDGPKSLPRT